MKSSVFSWDLELSSLLLLSGEIKEVRKRLYILHYHWKIIATIQNWYLKTLTLPCLKVKVYLIDDSYVWIKLIVRNGANFLSSLILLPSFSINCLFITTGWALRELMCEENKIKYKLPITSHGGAIQSKNSKYSNNGVSLKVTTLLLTRVRKVPLSFKKVSNSFR